MEHSSSCVQGALTGGGVALLSCSEERGLAMAGELGNDRDPMPGAQGRANATPQEVPVRYQLIKIVASLLSRFKVRHDQNSQVKARNEA